jgi:FixJ family two-component response regulator
MSEKKKILIVDDNQLWLETVEMILESSYDLALFTDPEQAMESLKETEYALVILDKSLPGTSGLDVLKEMRVLAPGLRAIMLTGYPDVESAVQSMKLGALDYLSKGTSDLPAALKARIEEALAGAAEPRERPVTELLARGESATLEFKSSARWDYRANKVNRDLERIIVKTVAAFLNSEQGGDLCIGVDDDGRVLGLAHDFKTIGKRQDRDGYENFLTTLLLDAFGKDSSPLLQITFHRVGEHDVCRVAVRPSPKPAYVKDEKGEHLFIRTGNSTRQLSTREAVDYCKLRWG